MPRTSAARRPRSIVEVERDHIRRFAEAIGDHNPIYVDEAAARAAGHPRIPAPPTFAIALRTNDPRDGIDIDWRKLLHGEQEFTFARPLYAGDRLTIVARIADAAVKQTKSGVMDVMVLETVATDGDGAACLHRALDGVGAPMSRLDQVRVGDTLPPARQAADHHDRSWCTTPAPRATSIASTTTIRSRAKAASRR